MQRVGDHLFLICAALVFCGPVLWLGARASAPGQIGEHWATLTRLLAPEANAPGLGRVVYVSTLLAVMVALLSTTLSFLAAFTFVFFRAPFTRFCFWAVIVTLYFPIEARMLQTFDVVAKLGLTSSFAGLALPVLQLALGALFFRQHLKRLPPQVFEAARLDGAGPVRCLWDIALPMSKPQIATIGLVTFIWGWNQYLWPLMVSVDDRHWTLVRALDRVGLASGAGLLLAFGALLPPLLLVVLCARSLAQMGKLRIMG